MMPTTYSVPPLKSVNLNFVDFEAKPDLLDSVLTVWISPRDNPALADLDYCSAVPVWISCKTEDDKAEARKLYARLRDLTPPPTSVSVTMPEGLSFTDFATGRKQFFPTA
jgi:hypothetical protein